MNIWKKLFGGQDNVNKGISENKDLAKVFREQDFAKLREFGKRMKVDKFVRELRDISVEDWNKAGYVNSRTFWEREVKGINPTEISVQSAGNTPSFFLDDVGLENKHQQTVILQRPTTFVEVCLDVQYHEYDDKRWFSHFKELPEIDGLSRSGKKEEALILCCRGLELYPDSFLFYDRVADLYDDLKRPEEAEQILMIGLSKSLSKCTLAGSIAERAFRKGKYRETIRWWIAGGILQLDSKIMVDRMPFLNLAYVCQAFGVTDTQGWLLEMADRASNQGPTRFDTVGAELRYRLARAAIAAGDDVVVHAIRAYHARYK